MQLLLATLLMLAPDDVERVEVVWRAADDDFPAQGVAHVKTDEDVLLGPLLFFKDGSCSVREGAYQDVDGVNHVCPRPFSALADWRAQYWRVIPTQMRVPRSPRGTGGAPRWHKSAFATVHVDRPVLAAANDDDDLPLGTMRYAVTLTDAEGNSVSSAADDDARKAMAVAVRLDDTWMGVLWELQGVPVVDGPRGVPPSQHDTSVLWGCDANTAIIYAVRRMGLGLPYLDVAEQPRMETVVVKRGVRRGDVLLRAGQPVVLMGPSLAADAPVLGLSTLR